jgi:hypothetical protein
MNIETTLRESLHAHSAEAPTNAGLLGAVEVRSSRRRQRRQVVGVGIAAAGVIAVVLTATTVVGGMADTGGDPAPPASVGAAPPTSPAASAPLVPASDLELPDFPFTPGWIPPGVTGPYYHHLPFGEAGEGLRSYLSSLDHYDPATGLPALRVEVTDQDYGLTLDKLEDLSDDVDEDETGVGPPIPLTRQAATVRGKDAVLLSNQTTAYLSWQHSDEQWVLVSGGPAQDVIRYAEELDELPFPARTPFAFEVLPDDAQLQWTSAHAMMFEPSTFAPGAVIDAVEVTLLRGVPGMDLDCPLSLEDLPAEELPDDSGECPLPRQPGQVGGPNAELVGDHMVVVYLQDGLALKVETAGSLALAGEGLLQFAAGIQVTPDAYPRP